MKLPAISVESSKRGAAAAKARSDERIQSAYMAARYPNIVIVNGQPLFISDASRRLRGLLDA